MKKLRKLRKMIKKTVISKNKGRLKFLKTLSFALLLILLFPTMTKALEGGNYLLHELSANQESRTMLNNLRFQDVQNHWARDSIYKMTSLSMARGTGVNTFHPDRYVSFEESLAFVMRLAGWEEEAQKLAESEIKFIDTGGLIRNNPHEDWSRGYRQLALDKGIISPNDYLVAELNYQIKQTVDKELAAELQNYHNRGLSVEQLKNIETILKERLIRKYTWEQKASREIVATWMARVLNLTPLYAEKQPSIYNFHDWKDIDTENVGFVETMLQNKLISGYPDGNFRPKDPITRAQVLAMMDNAFEQNARNLNYLVLTGIVQNKDSRSSYQANRLGVISEVKESWFHINNTDFSESYLLIKNSSSPELNQDIVYNYYGKLTDAKDLLIAEQIKYVINPEGIVLYVEKF